MCTIEMPVYSKERESECAARRINGVYTFLPILKGMWGSSSYLVGGRLPHPSVKYKESLYDLG